jgi:hypothetical protein
LTIWGCTCIGIKLQETPTENGENHMYGSKMGFLSEWN